MPRTIRPRCPCLTNASPVSVKEALHEPLVPAPQFTTYEPSTLTLTFDVFADSGPVRLTGGALDAASFNNVLEQLAADPGSFVPALVRTRGALSNEGGWAHGRTEEGARSLSVQRCPWSTNQSTLPPVFDNTTFRDRRIGCTMRI